MRQSVGAWWRLALVLLGVRRITPGLWERPGPRDLRQVEDAGDTGGGWYRPTHRQQDPAVDPREPGGGESSAAGNDHGWSGCTMTAGAMVLDFHTLGRLQKWGGDLRHRQGDLDGGTDLQDVREAWASYGEDLQVRSGKGWDALKSDRAAGRWLVVQGEGNVPGSESFTGGHGCALGPETNADGKWLFGDPLASGWQWVTPGSVQDWMRAWSSGYAWARSAAHPPPGPPPEPPPPAPPPPDRYPEGYQDGQADGLALGAAQAADAVFASWRPGEAWPPDLSGSKWDAQEWGLDAWSRPWPYPLVALLRNATLPITWDGAGWTAATWRQASDPPDPPDPPALPGFGEWDLESWPVSWA